MNSSDRSQENIDLYSDYHVQGSIIKSRLTYIHINHGAGAIKRLAQTLPPSVSAIVTSPIYIGEWYPLSALAILDRAIVNELSGGNEKIFEDLGVFSADLNLSGSYKPLIKDDIHEFLQLTTVLHKNYQDFGEAQYVRMGDLGALLQFRYPVPPPDGYCRSGMGYFRRAVELCGGQQVTVRKTGCLRQNDPFCEFRVEWKI